MQLDPSTQWLLATCFGAFLVSIYSWTRFDEPSYDSQTEYFARYKPRFSTSKSRYLRAKFGYIGAIIVIYIILCLVPELFKTLATTDGKPPAADATTPLGIALLLITLQNAPLLKDIERRIRGALHAIARIPEGVRRTVATMRSSQFTFNPLVVTLQTKKLALQAEAATKDINALIKSISANEIVYTWYCIGSLLFALSEQSRGKLGIDQLFFEYYQDELDNIESKHIALADLPRQRLVDVTITDSDLTLTPDLRNLRDRLYTFIACGVHFSTTTDAETFDILRRLGFADPYRHERRNIILQLAGLSFIAVMVLSIFVGFSTQLFRMHFLVPLGLSWRDAFPVPSTTVGLYTWSWSTALFYFAAIAGALGLRATRISRREWFNINDLKRERPILKYAAPVIVGTALGSVILLAIAVVGGPAFKPSLTDMSRVLLEGLRQSFPWFPLAVVMAFIALILSDSQPDDRGQRWRTVTLRAGIAGLIMGVVGFLTSTLMISTALEEFAVNVLHVEGGVPSDAKTAGVYVSLFIGFQIALFSAVLGAIVQLSEFYTTRSQTLVGSRLEIVARQGPLFIMNIGADGKASLWPPEESNAEMIAPVWSGSWTQFPEGTAIKWNRKDNEGRCQGGESGLISSYGELLIYEGYMSKVSGTADFIAQVRVV